MNRPKGQSPSRSELSERVSRKRQDYEQSNESLTREADDVDTARQTREGVELAGVVESDAAIEQALDSAQQAATSDFEQEGRQLEQKHTEGQELENDMNERAKMTAADTEKLREGQAKLHADTLRQRLLEAQAAASAVLEFLDQQEKEATEARRRSQQDYQRDLDRVQNERR